MEIKELTFSRNQLISQLNESKSSSENMTVTLNNQSDMINDLSQQVQNAQGQCLHLEAETQMIEMTSKSTIDQLSSELNSLKTQNAKARSILINRVNLTLSHFHVK